MKDFKAAVASKYKIKGDDPSAIVQTAINLAFRDGFELPEDMPAKSKDGLKKLSKVVKDALEASEKERAADKASAEKAKAEAAALAEKQKKTMTLAISKAEEKLAPAADKSYKATVNELGKFIGAAFTVKDGNLVPTKENITETEFAQCFAGLESLMNTSQKISAGIAKLEAQAALLAKKTIGDGWINYFSEKQDRIGMIKQNMKALEKAETIGIELTTEAGEIPIGVARALIETRISTGAANSDEINNAFRKEVLEEFIEKSNEKGRVLTANEARQLVAEKKNALKEGSSKVQYNVLYVFVVVKKGSEDVKVIALPSKDKTINAKTLSLCQFCIDRSFNTYCIVNGNIVKTAIALPVGKEMELLAKGGVEVETEKAAPPAAPAKDDKKKPAKNEPKKEEEKEKEEDELSFDDNSDSEDSADESPDEDSSESDADTETTDDEDGEDDLDIFAE